MNFVDFLPLLSAVFVCSLGFIVFYKNKNSRINFTFFLHALAITVWLFGTFMMFINKGNQNLAIFWDRFVYVGVVFIVVFMHHFRLAYTQKKADLLLYVGYFLSFLFLLLSRTKFFVDGIFFYKWGVHSRAGFFHHLFLLYFSIYVIIWFLYMYKYYKNITSARLKEQTKYIFAGFLALFTIGPLAYLPAYGIGIYPFAYVSGVIFTIIIAYAIVVHRLMDIKLVMRKYFVYSLSLISIIFPALIIKIWINSFYPILSFWLDFLILIVALIFFSPLKKFYYKIANKYFFSSLYDTKEVIEQVSDKLTSILNVKLIYSKISEILNNVFHPKSLAILTYDKKTGEYVMQHNLGLNTGRKRRFNEDKNLQKAYVNKSTPIIIEELKRTSYDQFKDIIDFLSNLGVEVLVPLDVKDKIIGLMALGPKESGDMYNEEDLAVLKVAGAQLAIVLENALLYEETKNFNVKLKKEVEGATSELRMANEQLKQLDEAKSEFISIASHQLRTPLTAIKGYISMMIEGDFGVLTPEEHSSLEKVYESNERLIKLVEDLLNISRIESGRLQFNFSTGNLENMVGGVVEELTGNANKKGLKIFYKKPDQLNKVQMDEDKLRQVVMNLIDNAIKYTKQGTVTVSLENKKEEDKEYVRFCVADSGMGITSDDLPNLFQKFSRGTGTSLIHTEGTGLGLYVARMMIEAHHGAIWAESDGEGKGSKFCFKLPIYG